MRPSGSRTRSAWVCHVRTEMSAEPGAAVALVNAGPGYVGLDVITLDNTIVRV